MNITILLIRLIRLILSKIKHSGCVQLLLATLIVLTANPVLAQDNPEQLLEALEDVESAEVSYVELLHDLQKHPVDINTASIVELLRIPFLTPGQAQTIVRHRRDEKFKSLNDLQNRTGLNPELISVLQPYLRIRAAKSRRPAFEYRVKLGRAAPLSQGYADNRYVNPIYMGQRLRWRNGAFFGGFLWEKDAGEANIADFGSMHLGLTAANGRFQLLLGDFTLYFGQGLLFSGAFNAMAVGGSTQPFRDRGLRIRAKSSLEENRFLRGVVTNLQFGDQWTATIAVSQQRRDARMDSIGGSVLSLSSSGYHRTASEIAKKDQLTEKLLATAVQFRGQHFSTGLLLNVSHYGQVLEFLQPAANRQHAVAISYSGKKTAFSISGEVAWSNPGKIALQNSFLLNSGKILWGLLSYAHSPRYYAVHGSRFGSLSTSPGNRRGHFLSIRGKIAGGLSLFGYLHAYQAILPDKDFAGSRRNISVEINRKSKRMQVSLRHTRRLRESAENRQNRLDIKLFPMPRLRITQRLLLSGADRERSGVSGYQEILWTFNNRWQVTARLSQFDTFESGPVYEFEPELPGGFRNVALSGRGSKWFLQTVWDINQHFQLAFKYRSMIYPDQTSLGSGADKIEGNKRGQFFFSMSVEY